MNRPLLLLIGAALAASPGCARREPVPLSGPAPIAPVAGRPSPRPGSAPAFSAPPASQAVRDRAALADSCRRDADRVVLYRDRGQLMREDERDARVGTDSSIYARRIETDRLGRVFERDRIAAECLDQGTVSPPRR